MATFGTTSFQNFWFGLGQKFWGLVATSIPEFPSNISTNNIPMHDDLNRKVGIMTYLNLFKYLLLDLSNNIIVQFQTL